VQWDVHQIVALLVYTTLAGACIPAGAALAFVERIQPQWLDREVRHFVIALGGGVLVAAVTLVLVPEGRRLLTSTSASIAAVIAGGLAFFYLERVLGRRSREVPQMSAMLSDYIPESIALGGMFAAGARSAPLLALLIGLQNLPEGFNAYRELASRPGADARRLLLRMLAFVPLGPTLAILGWLWLSAQPEILGMIMLFAAGGILYLIFQDIAPQAKLTRHWGPPLGAVCGFALGLLGQEILNTQ